MYGRSTIWFPLLLLAMLAALTLWIDRTVQPPEPKRDGSSRHDVDYRINNFTTTKTDVDGTPRYILSAVELRHFPDIDSTELTRPRFTQYAVNKPYTQIQAQRGLVSSSGDDVYFMDQVHVVRAAVPGRGEMNVLTEYLHLIPDQDIVETNQPVSILQAPHTTLRGTGMVYNKKERTLKMSGRVYVHYERPGADVQPLSAPPALKRTALAGVSKKAGAARNTVTPMAAQPGRVTKKNKATSKNSANKGQQHQPMTGKTTTRIRRQYEKPAR